MSIDNPLINRDSSFSMGRSMDRRERGRIDCSLEVIANINGKMAETLHLNNLSVTGANITLLPNTRLPERFTISGLVDGYQVPCKIAWRKNRQIGIKFEL